MQLLARHRFSHFLVVAADLLVRQKLRGTLGDTLSIIRIAWQLTKK